MVNGMNTRVDTKSCEYPNTLFWIFWVNEPSLSNNNHAFVENIITNQGITHNPHFY